MKQYKTHMIVLIALCAAVFCFFPRRIPLPDYDEAVMEVLERRADGSIPMALTEPERAGLYAALADVKGVYMPELFADYHSCGRTMYEIFMEPKTPETKGRRTHFIILVNKENQPEDAGIEVEGMPYRKIINAGTLADFLKGLQRGEMISGALWSPIFQISPLTKESRYSTINAEVI